MLRTIPSSTPWSSSDYRNLGKGSSNDLLDRGEEEELGEPDGLATMNLSQLTRRERSIPRIFKMYLNLYTQCGLEKD